MTTYQAQTRTVILLDDHEVIRHGLAARLAQERDLEVIGSHASSRELLTGMAQRAADVAVIDFMLGPADIDGVNLIRAVKVKFPNSKILVFSAHYSPATVALALQAGARGFIGKSQDMDELVAAIHTVARGQIYLQQSMAAEVALFSEERSQLGKGVDTLISNRSLSPREREVLRCCLDGMSVSDIASKFSRSANTISTQKQSAFRKLGIRTDNELFKIRHQLEKQ
jgi:two-component system, NarL family, captular synthesis response regulator RcsB